jgi:DNA-binding winged helix-turn-helix (wHTH) protein
MNHPSPGAAPPPATAIVDRDFRGRLLIGDHIVDLGALRLVSDPEVRITRKAAAVLIQLARHQDRTISRSELLDTVWAGTCPTPEVVTQAVMELRRVLGDDGRANSVIETVPRLGYRLAMPAVFQAHLPVSMTRRAAARDISPVPSSPMPAVPPAALAVSADASEQQAPSPPRVAPASGSSPHAATHAALWLVLLLIALLVLLPKLASPDGAPVGAAVGATAFGAVRVLAGSTGAEYFPDLAPDAASVVFSAPDRASNDLFKLYEKGVGSSAATRVTLDAIGEELLPSIAPDGVQLAYVRMHEGRCEVRVMRIPGGANRPAFACTVDMPPYLEWSADSRRLLTYGREPGRPAGVRLFEYRVDDGTLEWLDYPRGDSDVDVEPRYAPDGRIAFRRGVRPASRLLLLDRERGTLAPIVDEPLHLLGFDWLDAPPRLLAALRADEQTRLVTITLDGHMTPSGIDAAQYPRVRGDRIVFMRGDQHVGVAAMTLAAGPAKRTFRALSVGHNTQPAYAPDGRTIAFVREHGSDRRLSLLHGGSETPVPIGPGFAGRVDSLSWSADGRRLLLLAEHAGRSTLYLADVGAGTLQALPVEGATSAAFDMSADAIWFTAAHADGQRLHRLVAPASSAPLIVATGVAADWVQTRAGTDGIFVRDRCIVRLDAALAPVQTFCPPPEHGAWRVGDGSVWTFRENGMRNVSVYRYDLAGAALAEVGEYPLWWAAGSFDVSPGETELLYAAFNADESHVAIAGVRSRR